MLAEGAYVSRAELARKLRVSRARVTQVLGLLDLVPEVLEAVVGLGDPLPRPIVTERMLRRLLKLSGEEQRRVLQDASLHTKLADQPQGPLRAEESHTQSVFAKTPSLGCSK